MSPLWLKHMHSVLFALTWWPMPAAARSTLCSKVSAWADLFARCDMSSVLSASVIVCAGYLLLLFFASLKPLSFIKSTNVISRYKQVWGKCVSLQHTCYNVDVVCVSIRWAYFYFRGFVLLYSKSPNERKKMDRTERGSCQKKIVSLKNDNQHLIIQLKTELMWEWKLIYSHKMSI